MVPFVSQSTVSMQGSLNNYWMSLCDIQNNEGQRRVISLSLWPRLITLTETLIIMDITKTESNNCFTSNNQRLGNVDEDDA